MKSAAGLGNRKSNAHANCFTFYTIIHQSLPKDRETVEVLSRREK